MTSRSTDFPSDTFGLRGAEPMGRKLIGADSMKTEALSTLSKLASGSDKPEERDKREKRLRSLLRSPDAADGDWFMHVPEFFNEALDIRLTRVVTEPDPIWTQGANF